MILPGVLEVTTTGNSLGWCSSYSCPLPKGSLCFVLRTVASIKPIVGPGEASLDGSYAGDERYVRLLVLAWTQVSRVTCYAVSGSLVIAWRVGMRSLREQYALVG